MTFADARKEVEKEKEKMSEGGERGPERVIRKFKDQKVEGTAPRGSLRAGGKNQSRKKSLQEEIIGPYWLSQRDGRGPESGREKGGTRGNRTDGAP